MPDREKVIDELIMLKRFIPSTMWEPINDAIALLKEQEKKQITIHKRHVITLRRNDIFSLRNLYESICETLMDEGSLIIVRKDDHEKVEFEWEIVDNSET